MNFMNDVSKHIYSEVQIQEALLGRLNPQSTLDFLKIELLPQVKDFLNHEEVRKLAAIYAGERVPENERNLTDVRNRMSLLIEHSIVDAVNSWIKGFNISDLWLSNVVANRFPDLEMRKITGEIGLRLEIKCLQSIAEEKSANFSTLKKDINPYLDYVVVVLWDWDNSNSQVAWDRAPKVLEIFVFHAASLATIRDYRWLNNPPANIGKGLQGFDLLVALTSKDGVYKEEEGNYGKLLRIWSRTSSPPSDADSLVKRTIDDYLIFEDVCVASGFVRLSELISDSRGFAISVNRESDSQKGFILDNSRSGYFLGRRLTIEEAQSLAAELRLENFIFFTDKYSWKLFGKRDEEFLLEDSGAKPKNLYLNQI